ncbi:MAG: metallophosphoesterase, partial [Pirellulales bacterium]
MELFDHRNYVPLGPIILILLLPIIVWLVSGDSEPDEPARQTASPEAARTLKPREPGVGRKEPAPRRPQSPPPQQPQPPPEPQPARSGAEPPDAARADLRSELSARLESNKAELKDELAQAVDRLTVAVEADREAQQAKLQQQLSTAVNTLGDSLREELKTELREAAEREVDAEMKAALGKPRRAAETRPADTPQTPARKQTEPAGSGTSGGLPIDADALKDYRELKHYAIGNLISLEDLHKAIRDGSGGLKLDFRGVTELLDGTGVDPTKIHGTAYCGPYPFEAAEAGFAYKRFRLRSSIRGGRAALKIGRLLKPKYNSEQWIDRGTLSLRVVLRLEQPGRDRPLGTYDTFTAFVKDDAGFNKRPWLVQGPSVNRLASDAPSRAVLRFKTDEPVPAVVLLDDGRELTSRAGREHVVPITQLPAGRRLGYRIRVGELTSRRYTIQAAPAKGAGPVRFAYCGDSREGVGTGEQALMGVNYQTLQRHAARAYRRGAQFFLFGGDLIHGYTTSPPDFRTQLAGWKQAMAGYWAERPVYPAMGNHEALLRVFRHPGGGRVMIDRWPYAGASAEAVFAAELLNPDNGPTPVDPRRPPYSESVFTFQFGLVRVIAVNNNYWYSDAPQRVGGSPEGYIFDDQLRWIENWLDDAERDPTVKYVVLYAQEPVFPCGGHTADAMWYDGDNNVRAYTYRDGSLGPARDGILDVRNRLALAVARSSKVAAVLCSDEHAYYRVLIERRVPVGVPRRDDRDRDGVIDWEGGEPASPLNALPRPVWYLTSGGGGAPYYA